MRTSIILFIIGIFLAFLLTGCINNDESADIDVESVKIQHESDTLRLDKNDIWKANIKTEPLNQAVSFYSTDNNILSVTKDGTVTAKGPGMATLYAVALNGANRTRASLTVNVIGYVESIAVKEGLYIVIPEGNTANVASLFIAYPANATNTKLVFKSSNTAVATVDADGNIAVLSKGIAEISAVPADGKNDIKSGTVKIYSMYATARLDKRGWTAIASEEASDYFGASKVIDGKASTFWHNDWNNDASSPPWSVLIDMKQEREFNKIAVWRRSDYDDTRTVEVYITDKTGDNVAINDESFVKIGTLDYGDMPGNKSLLLLDFWLDDVKHKSRYLKLVLPDTNSSGNNSLAEVSLYIVG